METDFLVIHECELFFPGKKSKYKHKDSKISITYAINVIKNTLFQSSKSNLKRFEKAKTLQIKQEPIQQNYNQEKEIIDSALLEQISDIKIRLLLDSDKENEEQKNLPNVEFIELTLLNQSLFSLSKFKKYGFSIYVFFFYLRNLLFTFFVLFGFVFYYMYCIFFKYYSHYEDEYSLFFDYNLLTLVSGVQIIRFRKYYINEYGKEAFLEKYKNFDVFYKEYFYSGALLFIFVFLVNFFLIIYMIRSYETYKLKNQENFHLILSGPIKPRKPSLDSKQLKDEDKKEIKIIYNENEIELTENNLIEEQKLEKEKAIKEKEEREKKDLILEELGMQNKMDDIDIDFTFKLSDYYQKIEEINSLEKEYKIYRHRLDRNKCSC